MMTAACGFRSAIDEPTPAPTPSPRPSAPLPNQDPPVQKPEGRVDRDVVFNGELRIEVADVASAEASMRPVVDAAQGWIHRICGDRFTLRVPGGRFHAVMQQLAGLGRVLDRRVEGNDITEELRDLRVRVESAEKILNRLLALLEKAATVVEALAIEREIARVTVELEASKAKLLRLSDQAAFSTIELELWLPAPTPRPQPSRTVRFPFAWLRELDVSRLTDVLEY